MKTFWRVTRWARAVRFWLFVLVALAAWVGCSGEAQAACVNTGGYNYTCDTRPEAYAKAQQVTPAAGETWGCTSFRGGVAPPPHVVSPYWNGYTVTARCNAEGYTGLSFSQILYESDCPADRPWHEASGTCGGPCMDAPPIVGAATRGSVSACYNGCRYNPDPSMLNACLSVGHDVAGGAIAPDYCMAARWRPTGEECGADNTEPNDPGKPTCISTGGGFAHCVMADGSQCVTGASGRRYCWGSGETGPRSSGDGTEGASLGTSESPPVAPPSMKDPSPVGEGGTATVGSTTSITQNFVGAGNAGGQSNVGPGGSDAPGSGVGGGDRDGDGPGSVGGDLSGLYEGGERTVASVFAAFQARVSAAPVGQMVADFLSMPSGGGGCPVITIPGNEYWDTLTFTGLCSGELATLLQYAGYLFLAFVAVVAVRIAFGG